MGKDSCAGGGHFDKRLGICLPSPLLLVSSWHKLGVFAIRLHNIVKPF
jgi:hypothetical protein